MKAFVAAARAAVSYFDSLYPLFGLCLLWWVTGGMFMFLAAVTAVPLLLGGLGSPWWLTPILAIPSGPALAAMAVVARRSARQTRIDRALYMGALRQYWRPAMRLSTGGAAGLTLVLLNLVFYAGQQSTFLRLISVVWGYLGVFWTASQMYAYTILVGAEKPRTLFALRTAVMVAFANPLFSALLVAIVAVLTAISTALVAPLLIAWPALVALLGEHAVRIFLARAGLDTHKGEAT